MCGRVTLTRDDIAEIADDLEAEISPADAARYRRRYNVAPSDRHWILQRGQLASDRRVLVPAVWGYLASGRPLINVRGEQVGSGAGFKNAFGSRRCVVVTDGFFEWTTDRAPFWYHRDDAGLVLLGGLYQTTDAIADQVQIRFTILTTRPNRLVSRVHNRMPVVLSRTDVEDWLTAPSTRAAELIVPAQEDALVATPVSRRVNSVKHDDPECLAPFAEPGAGPGAGEDPQRRLF
jgi:putative SOS response-associated peptidase YedK